MFVFDDQSVGQSDRAFAATGKILATEQELAKVQPHTLTLFQTTSCYPLSAVQRASVRYVLPSVLPSCRNFADNHAADIKKHERRH